MLVRRSAAGLLLGGAAAVLALGGCAPSYLQLARLEAPPKRRALKRAGPARVEAVQISSGADERAGRTLAAERALREHLANALVPRDLNGPPLELKLHGRASLDSCCQRGYRGLRVAFLNPFVGAFGVLWPLWPETGKAEVGLVVEARLTDPRTRAEKTYHLDLEVRVPYSVYWYAWARTTASSGAFEVAWRVVADQAAAHVAAWAERELARPQQPPDALEPSTPLEPSAGLRMQSEWYARERPRPDAVSERRGITVQDESAWRVITTADLAEQKPRGLLLRYAGALGGLDAGYLLGQAWVSSAATDSFGRKYTVAAGDATTRGYRFDLHALPEKSSWFLYPTLGFLSLDIDIHDFREQIPTASVPGATEIPGVGSDPATGAPVDLGDPNVYRLFLRSVYVGQRLSATLVVGTRNVQLFGTFEGGFNIIEFRHARVQLGKFETSGWSFPWFFSGKLKGIVGLVIRPWHVALRCEGHYEAYREYAYPEPLEFMGRVEYNAAKQKFERKRTFVDAATVGVANVLFSLNVFL